ncbi:MAG: (d)CMP kinase [Bacteroidia bacterium]|nr:(d)CMP kinase [Bacteroidia bacterium]
MDTKINIAIDGHSSCGKGTLAKNIAKELGYLFIDSGAMYRAVTLYLLNEGISLEELNDDPAILGNIKIDFVLNPEKKFFETYLNQVNVEHEIRNMRVSKYVSPVSTLKVVRDFLVKKQQEIGQNKGVVMDGRDIGSVVFPDAELKLFITASLKERTLRRFSDLKNVSMEEIERNLDQRDYDDSNREENPLVQSKDAILIDNTNLSKKEQLELILGYCNKVILG